MGREPSSEVVAMAIRICMRADEVADILCKQRYPTVSLHDLPREVRMPAQMQGLVVALIEFWSDDAP